MKFSYDPMPMMNTLLSEDTLMPQAELINETNNNTKSDNSINRYYDGTLENENFPPAA